jgi:antitoxin component HigA of HigAB toxin-antitoxin module
MAATAEYSKVPELLLAINASGKKAWDIARDANLHPVKLSRVLNRHQRLTLDEAKRLARVLNAHVHNIGDIIG